MVTTIYNQENTPKVRLNGKVLINAMITRFDYFTYRAETTQEGKTKNISTLYQIRSLQKGSKNIK